MPNDLQINPALLAELAQRESDVLDKYPLQEKPYDFEFIVSGIRYTFSYDGKAWKWNYEPVS